jgi:hypothetical protein
MNRTRLAHLGMSEWTVPEEHVLRTLSGDFGSEGQFNFWHHEGVRETVNTMKHIDYG